MGDIMKRMILCTLCVLLLSGCGILGQRAYVSVEPHQEDYQKSPDSDTITVSSYGGLKNAILSLVEDGVKEGVLRTEGYSGDLDADLSQAVYEVTQVSPLGVFAVDHMTYDYSRIVSYYEIHLNIAFRRQPEEITSIIYVTDMDAALEVVRETMESYEPHLILRVGSYEFTDMENAVDEIYETHPEFALEKPVVAVAMYPDSGTQRIMEIDFTYRSGREELLERRDQLQQEIAYIARIYGSAQSDMTNAKRLYKRLGRDAALLEDTEETEPAANSVYGLLLEERATTYGFAQAYLSLLNACEIKGELVSGRRNGVRCYWCLVRLDGDYYYVDPSFSPQNQNTEFFLMGSDELLEFGYQMFNESKLPEVVLPAYLKPGPPPET